MNLMTRIETMMDHGQVFSEPATLSNTDKMLDTLLARGRSPASANHASRHRPPRAFRRPTPGDHGRRRTNWLGLPSLSELMDVRRGLIRQDRQQWDLESDAALQED